MKWLEAELKPKLEKLSRESGDEVQVAQIMLDLKKTWGKSMNKYWRPK